MAKHHGLQCRVQSIHYNFDARAGYIELPEGNCVDMDGCIAMFENLDANAQRIWTFAGEELDVSFLRTPADWKAVPPEIGGRFTEEGTDFRRKLKTGIPVARLGLDRW